MPRRFPSSLISATIFALSLTMTTGSAAVPPPNAPPETPQAVIAIEFLKRLENGQYSLAHVLLDDSIRRTTTLARLRAARPPGTKNAVNYRIVRYERSVRYGLVKGGRPSKRYYVVCMSDRPQRGSGGMGYVAVTLSNQPPSRLWRVYDFRFQSDIPIICR